MTKYLTITCLILGFFTHAIWAQAQPTPSYTPSPKRTYQQYVFILRDRIERQMQGLDILNNPRTRKKCAELRTKVGDVRKKMYQEMKNNKTNDITESQYKELAALLDKYLAEKNEAYKSLLKK